jgi:hypothetical protein
MREKEAGLIQFEIAAARGKPKEKERKQQAAQGQQQQGGRGQQHGGQPQHGGDGSSWPQCQIGAFWPKFPKLWKFGPNWPNLAHPAAR